MVRPDQVDGNRGFAYVGRLFHGWKYSSQVEPCSMDGQAPAMSIFPVREGLSRGACALREGNRKMRVMRFSALHPAWSARVQHDFESPP